MTVNIRRYTGRSGPSLSMITNSLMTIDETAELAPLLPQGPCRDRCHVTLSDPALTSPIFVPSFNGLRPCLRW
jgi:hypothetical protein